MSGDQQWRAQIERRLAEIEAELAAARHDAVSSPNDPRSVIHTRSMGNIANRMIQYMAALALQTRLPAARLSNITLPEWGIVEPQLDVREPAWRVPTERIDLDRVARIVADGQAQDVVLLQYLQHVANLLPPDHYRTVFGRRPAPAHVFGDDVLVISLRMGEVLTGFYPYYTLLPVAFYRDVVRETGLRPVFFGQLTPSPYLDALRAAFPDAAFIAGTDPMSDFEVLRSARNLCLSVSTFSWTAGFLSEAARIVIPVTGLFSPHACACLATDHDLVPRRDPRYEHWLFPINFAVPSDQVLDYHAELDGAWRRVSSDELDQYLGGSLTPQRFEDYERLFDSDFYLRTHREIADAVADGRLGRAEHHYTLHGFAENRACFALDAPY